MNATYGTNFNDYKQLGLSKLKERAKLVRENKDFANKVSLILEDDIREKEDLEKRNINTKILDKIIENLRPQS